MIAIIGIVLLVGLAICFFVLRFMGSMGQKPSSEERMKHTAGNPQHQHPRAPGLN
jgi:flagellar biogenesis protein FliO